MIRCRRIVNDDENNALIGIKVEQDLVRFFKKGEEISFKSICFKENKVVTVTWWTKHVEKFPSLLDLSLMRKALTLKDTKNIIW